MASGTRRFATAALAAGATSPNLLADDTLRYPGQPSGLTIAATCAVAGAGTQTLQVEVGNQIVYTGILPSEAIVGRGPILPDDNLVSTGLAAGDQISVRVTNGSGVPVISTVLIDVVPA
jgi:hypothetical protein